MVPILVLGFLFQLSTPKPPIDPSGFRAKDLVKMCEAVTIDGAGVNAGGGYCLGFINGFMDGVEVTQAISEKKVLCPPQTMVDTLLVRVFLSRARSHPEELDDSARDQVAKAFIDAFVCREDRETKHP